nr:MAG TPA: hypothetical protein [Caudoviricetes sp.]
MLYTALFFIVISSTDSSIYLTTSRFNLSTLQNSSLLPCASSSTIRITSITLLSQFQKDNLHQFQTLL